MRKALNSGNLRRILYQVFLTMSLSSLVFSLALKVKGIFGERAKDGRQPARVFREGSVLCFTETWLHDNVPDTVVNLAGFHLVRADRSCNESGKKKGGGVAIYVNNRWCNPGHITMKERVCSPDIELLAVSLFPYYLPRKFSQAIVYSGLNILYIFLFLYFTYIFIPI